MKLYFDENLSPKLVDLLSTEYPGSSHPEFSQMRKARDSEIWDYANRNGFIIVSKDNDFRQRAFLEGAPPKVIWLSVGNAGTESVEELLRSHLTVIQQFANSPEDGLLVLRISPEEEG